MRVKSKGTVYLVGAGPGDAGLLTLRGAELLRRAEVVISDVLVNPELLRHASPSAEIISRGNHKRDGGMSQEQITELMLARAREGKTVVRLKGGDPFIFGRGGEEAEMLARGKNSIRSRSGRLVHHGGGELRRHSSHPSRALLQLHCLHRPQRFRRRAHRAALRADRQNPRHQGRADGHGQSRRLDKIAHRARHESRNARGRRPSRHDGPAEIRRRHAGDDRKACGKRKNFTAGHHHYRRRGEVARKN